MPPVLQLGSWAAASPWAAQLQSGPSSRTVHASPLARQVWRPPKKPQPMQ